MADTKHIAKIIAKRDDISLEEAQEVVEQTVDEIDTYSQPLVITVM